jgi:iron complex outermembrane recepter protein
MRGRALRGAILVAVPRLGPAAMARETLPTMEAVGVSPVAGSDIEIPSNVVSIGPSAFSHTKTADFVQAMIQGIPFVAPSDQSSNQFQIDLDCRGFTASRESPSTRTARATRRHAAVWSTGTLIPEMAISPMALMPNNPLFDLNAVGDAFPSI